MILCLDSIWIHKFVCSEQMKNPAPLLLFLLKKMIFVVFEKKNIKIMSILTHEYKISLNNFIDSINKLK
jgi:hypothetical protein